MPILAYGSIVDIIHYGEKEKDGMRADSMRLSHHIPALDQKQRRGEHRLYKF